MPVRAFREPEPNGRDRDTWSSLDPAFWHTNGCREAGGSSNFLTPSNPSREDLRAADEHSLAHPPTWAGRIRCGMHHGMQHGSDAIEPDFSDADSGFPGSYTNSITSSALNYQTVADIIPTMKANTSCLTMNKNKIVLIWLVLTTPHRSDLIRIDRSPEDRAITFI
ncbi:uncharacterized protein N7482_008412 [Penicillium canariense]|uniref:Uncharacterized protein n=1 Tax=Penicillium canariense TaxID=189055 RepID=A0A9W9HVQ0_9EURO|nr:uncharacterized protein N7482_008412 [Penicillium canariense]KAJ5157312.1 hypothetical protein N7482_008412 [Penicillium canariense]